MKRTANSIFAMALLALLAAAAWAAKPGGGGAVPPGTIFFGYGGAAMQMKADGAAKQGAPSEFGTVSLGAYGSPASRWHLTTADYQLWATNDGVTQMQLTNMLETDNGDGTKTMLRLIGPPSWSNDGADSFVSVAGIHWVQFQSDPIPPPVYWDYYRCIVRLNISALEMQVRHDTNLGDPLLSLADAEFVVTTPYSWSENLAQHHWSHDGSRVAYLFRDETQGTNQHDVYVADVGPGVTLPVDALDSVKVFESPNTGVWAPRWAPSTATDPERIALIAQGVLYTVRPDATGLSALCTTGSGFTSAVWSPDGQHLAFRQITTKGFTTNYQISRVPAAGGSITVLTGDLDRTVSKTVSFWRQ